MIPTFILEWVFAGLLIGGFFGYLLRKVYTEEEKQKRNKNWWL